MSAKTAEDRYVQVDGIRTRYRQHGPKGAPIVLLHGLGRSLEDWDEAVTALAARYRTFALDLPGFGRTARPAGRYSLPGFAEFVVAALDALGLEQAVLAGTSLGGAVALQTAAIRPARVRALVLVGSAGFGREVTLGLRLCTLPWLGERLTRPSRASAARTLREIFYDPRLITPERIERELALARRPGAQQALLQVVRALGTVRGIRPQWRAEIIRRLQNVRTPALVVWGREDRVLPVKHAEVARQLLPHARVEVFNECGHFPQIERAAAFNALLLEFLEQLGEPGHEG